MNGHEELVNLMFERVCAILKISDVKFKIMNRQKSKSNQSYVAGYINLRTRLIVLDIYTPKTLKPKSLNGLIRVLAHEIAHIQKPPYQQFHRGRWIVRQHYPAFYQQTERNINKIKKDNILGVHFKS
ncbi:hypothetical protein KKC32_01655 [Patescibacteria group bacterium]|nr:hypothetical protein [Patescibacteria group bacterium]